MKALVGARILEGDTWRDHHALLVDGDTIAGVVPVAQLGADVARDVLPGGVLLPGFIDTQVNGGGGVLLNDAPTVDGVRAIAKAHRAFGTTGLLPTLISDDFAKVASAIKAVDDAIADNVPGVLGIHLEGPFLNPDKRGIHDASKFRRIDAKAIDLFSSLKRGKTLVTLAPELANAGTIKALVDRGVVVAVGHSLATYEQMQSAFAEGLTGVTHLYNAMSQLGSRAPGIVGASLERSGRAPICGVIVDGHHVDPAALRVALAARGRDGLMLVTDAMPSVGATIDHFMLGTTRVTLKDGMLTGPDGTLGGSHLDMAGAVRNSMQMMRVDLATASYMASVTPATLLGMRGVRGTLSAGRKADIVHLDDALNVTATWISGVR